MGQGFLQSLSLSAATVKDSVSGDNKLSGGFRFKLINGQPVKELDIARAELKTKTTVLSIINGFMNIVQPGVLDTKQNIIDAMGKAFKKAAIPASIIEDFTSETWLLSDHSVILSLISNLF